MPNRKTPKRFKSLVIAGIAMAMTACAANSNISETKTTKPVVVPLKKGQVFQLALPKARPGGEAARKTYFKTAIPLAESFGDERLGQLRLKKIVGDFDPGIMVFYAFPSETAKSQFEAHPDWPAFKATRKDAWSELKIYSQTIGENMTLSFNPDKHYTVAFAWYNPENPNDYDRYMDGIEDTVEGMGGQFIYKMHNPHMEAHASSTNAPGQITFVEWPTADGLNRLRASQAFKDHAKYFQSGLSKFEFFSIDLAP